MSLETRDIIIIDEDLCDGCGDCITACAEGALEIVNGKAKLKGDILCDGAGACLGHCPVGALTVIKREAVAYDEAAVEVNLKQMKMANTVKSQPKTIHQSLTTIPTMSSSSGGGCPGSAARQWANSSTVNNVSNKTSLNPATPVASELRQWPVQLTLVSPTAPYFQGADLLIAADCVPFAMADFHSKFLKGKALVVGCPKLDDLQHYLGKLTEIFRANSFKSVEVLLMEVPCCSGIGQVAGMAKQQSGATFPLVITTISLRGDVLASETI